MNSDPNFWRLQDLLIDRALEGLDPDQQTRLDEILAKAGESADDPSYDICAAAIHLACSRPVDFQERIPAELMTRIEAHLTQQPSGVQTPFEKRPGDGDHRRPSSAPPFTPPPSSLGAVSPVVMPSAAIGGWIVFAAFLVTAALLWPGLDGASPTARVNHDLRKAPDLVRVSIDGSSSPLAGTLGGEVMWSTAFQCGLLLLHGLPANDPRRNQYQVWIYDRSRDPRYPVMGAIFDVRSDRREVEVPIEARLPIHQPQRVAVSLECAGGEWVPHTDHFILNVSLPR